MHELIHYLAKALRHQWQATRERIDRESLERIAKKASQLNSQEKYSAAEKLYKKLIVSEKVTYKIYGEFAVCCGMQGDIENLKYYSQKALEIKADYAQAHNNLGYAYQSLGDILSAIKSYKNAIQIRSDYADAYFNLGNAEKENNNATDAIKCYRKAISLKPSQSKYQIHLGRMLESMDSRKDASNAYLKAIEINPLSTDAYLSLGKMLAKEGEHEKAIELYKITTKLNNDEALPYFLIGNSLRELAKNNEAILYYKKGLKIQANSAEALMNLGNLYHEIDDDQSAILAYTESIAINSNNADAFYNLGIAQRTLGKTQAAITSFQEAIERNENALYYFNLGTAQLTLGDYKNGLENYEWRHQLEEKDKHILEFSKTTPHTRSQQLSEQELIIVGEQGVGDLLQFMRYIPTLRDKGYQCEFCVHPKMHKLIKASGIAENPLTIDQANQLSSKHWIPLLTLPKLLEVRTSDNTYMQPYIKCDANLSSSWRKRLSTNHFPVIGINWSGNRSEKERTQRNIQLSQLRNIVEKENITIVSLQRGTSEMEELPEWFKQKYTDYQHQIHSLADSNDPGDFLEYASIINSCDLVLTTATTVAHLAAGMGTQTWIMLQKTPDWRWGLEGRKTFWYQSARLFRQETDGCWEEPLKKVYEELKSLIDTRDIQ